MDYHPHQQRPLETVNGHRPNCANCHEPGAKYRGKDGYFYCGEFCEEGGPQRREP